MLKNGNFEEGWWRKTHTGQEFGEIFVPLHWTAYWQEGPPVPHDPHNHEGYGRPEMHVISKEPPFLNPLRIYEGQQALKFFTMWRIHKAGIYQRVEGLVPGALYEVSGFAHAWSSNDDDPHTSDTGGDGLANFTFALGLDPMGGEDPWAQSVVWGDGAHIYDQYASIPTLHLRALETAITVFVRSSVLWPFKHCDAYIDQIDLRLVDDEGECRGIPREQYERTYWLMPQSATLEEIKTVAEMAYPSRGTVGFSADDAGIGDLDARHVKAIYPQADSWDGDALEAFFNNYYPGVTVEHVHLGEEPPGPPPPPGPGPRSANLIGTHSGYPKEGWDTYLEQAQASIIKVFSGGFAEEARVVAPDALIVWRKFADDYVDVCSSVYSTVNAAQVAFRKGAYVDRLAKKVGRNPAEISGAYVYGSTIAMEVAERWRGVNFAAPACSAHANALKLVDYYTDEINTIASHTGRTESQVVEDMAGTVLESLNEKVPTHNAQQINKAVAFDVAFAEILHSRYGGLLVPGVLTVAIGNPHETEVPLLLPAVEAAVAAGGYIGYHGYWTSNENRSCLEEHWQWHAGRWTEWDKVFNQHNLYPKYYLGECGIVYASECTNFSSGQGWRSCGSFERYIEDIDLFNTKMNEWNAAHGNRCYGGTLFGYGNWGWDNFEIGVGDLALLRQYAIDNWL